MHTDSAQQADLLSVLRVMPKQPVTTDHLSAAMRGFYRAIGRKYQLAPHHKKLLMAACEAHDEMTTANDRVRREGQTVVDRHGQVRPHPCVAISRDARTSFARLIRELGLADEAEAPRPPRLTGRYNSRG